MAAMSNDEAWARSTAERLLSAELPRRWSHVQGVARRAATSIGDPLVVCAAWLHDIGYCPALVQTGFHPIDGARWLRARRTDERLVSLVANHSCAYLEASLRGLGEVLADEFPKDPALRHDELCFCDVTTSPDGELVSVHERIAEIRSRYPDGHVVRDFIDLAEPLMVETVACVEARLETPAGGAQSR